MARKREYDQILGHADEADGIEEYDNPLPDWWVGMFLFSIVWAVGYGIDYHFISDRSQAKAYEAEMTTAAERWPNLNEVATVDMSPEAIAKGREIFAANCVGCHGVDLHGGIGPNLTDTEWIHGGSPEEVTKTITDGVPAKGMVSWGPLLGPEKIAQVAAFVLDQNTGEAPVPPADGPGTAEPEIADVGSSGPDDGLADTRDAASVAPTDPIAAGKVVYDTNCIACHGPELQGLVGPNLTDDEWIHGGSREEIRNTIVRGVPEKGMVTWGPILGDEKIDRVTDFILSKQATH